MFLSLFLIILLCLALSYLCKLLRLPALIAYLAVGVLLGPFCLNLIDEKLLSVSLEMRKIALIFILLKAGLSLDVKDLKRMGRQAVLMSFVPAMFEIVAVGVLAPLFFDISYLDAFLLGSVLGAVSPAVVVPRMTSLLERRIGTKEGVPQLVIAGASVDDVVVIVAFTALSAMSSGSSISAMTILNAPISIVLGIVAGVLLGILLYMFFQKFHIRDTVKVMLLCAISFGLVALEDILKGHIGFSGLLAIMTMGVTIYAKKQVLAERLSKKYSKLWLFAEILLFVFVGASVNLQYFAKNLGFSLALILCALVVRSGGVFLSLLGSSMNFKERLFVVFSYLPKATVQAAIGSIPLSMGIASGALILSVAVVAILFTAPIGAFLIDFSSEKLLEKDTDGHLPESNEK